MFLKNSVYIFFKIHKINYPFFISINYGFKQKLSTQSLKTNENVVQEEDNQKKIEKSPAVDSNIDKNDIPHQNNVVFDPQSQCVKLNTEDSRNSNLIDVRNVHSNQKVKEGTSSSKITTSLDTDIISVKPSMQKKENSPSICGESSKKSSKHKKKNKNSLKNSTISKNYFTYFLQKIKAFAQKFVPSFLTDYIKKLKKSSVISKYMKIDPRCSSNKNIKNSSTLSGSKNLAQTKKSKQIKNIPFNKYVSINYSEWIYSQNFKDYFRMFKKSYFLSMRKPIKKSPKHDSTLLKNKSKNISSTYVTFTAISNLNIKTLFISNIKRTILGDIEFQFFWEEYQAYFTEQREFGFTNLPIYDYIHNGEIKNFDLIFDLLYASNIPKFELNVIKQKWKNNITSKEKKLLDLYNFQKIKSLNKMESISNDVSFTPNDYVERRDFSDHFIFSIDSNLGNIMEDVFSYRKDENSKTEEFGLHTLDIERFLKDYSDEESKVFFLSLAYYLPFMKIRRLFNDNILVNASLRPKFNHFTISAIIKYVDGKFSSVWIGKGIVNSKMSLCHKNVHDILRGKCSEYSLDYHKEARRAILAFKIISRRELSNFSDYENDTNTDQDYISMESMNNVLQDMSKYIGTKLKANFFEKIQYPIPVSEIFNYANSQQPQKNFLAKTCAHYTCPLRRYSDIIIQKFINIYSQKDSNEIIKANFGIMLQLIFWTNIRMLQHRHINKELILLNIVQKFCADINCMYFITKDDCNNYVINDDRFSFLNQNQINIIAHPDNPSAKNFYLRIHPLNHRSLDTYEIFLNEVKT